MTVTKMTINSFINNIIIDLLIVKIVIYLKKKHPISSAELLTQKNKCVSTVLYRQLSILPVPVEQIKIKLFQKTCSNRVFIFR